MRDKYNIIPVCMAALLHAAFITSLLVAFDFGHPMRLATPLIIEAELVSDLPDTSPPRVVKPEPEPVVEEPEPEPEPEIDEERIAAEERVRQEELAREQQRIAAEAEAERKRKAVAEAERKKKDEAELERKRVEAERKRQEEVERQRLENERKRKEALAAEAATQRQREIDEEEKRLAAMNSPAAARYHMAIQQEVMRSWTPPASARPGIECYVEVRQLPGGEVISAVVQNCNGDEAVKRSIEAAVFRASPLPDPEDPNIFVKVFTLNFKPEQ